MEARKKEIDNAIKELDGLIEMMSSPMVNSFYASKVLEKANAARRFLLECYQSDQSEEEVLVDYINNHYCFGDEEAVLGKTAAEIVDYWTEDGLWYIDDHQLDGIEVLKIFNNGTIESYGTKPAMELT